MTKTELISTVAYKTDLTKKDAEQTVNAVIECIQEALASGDKVVLTGFGSFEVRQRAARTGHNPRSGEPIEIPEVNAPIFKAGKSLKDAVAK